MNIDSSGLQRIKLFMEFIQQTKGAGAKLSFHSTPTEHGDNINVSAILNGERQNTGILFWDVSFLQNQGLADVLDDDDQDLGLNITDGLVEDVDKILSVVNGELDKLGSS